MAQDFTDVTNNARLTMIANRGRDTRPELLLRSELHRRGLRFRVAAPLPIDRRRRADVTFTRVGLFVFVDGCFWHGCPAHFIIPKTRTEFWVSKIAANRVRDLDTTTRLERLGGTVLRFWEHHDPQLAADDIEKIYRNLRAAT